MGTAITTLLQWLFGIKSEQDRAIDRNRQMAEQRQIYGTNQFVIGPTAVEVAIQKKTLLDMTVAEMLALPPPPPGVKLVVSHYASAANNDGTPPLFMISQGTEGNWWTTR